MSHTISEWVLQELLSPESHTPEPLNAIFTWLLLQVLKAIGAFRPTDAVLEQVKFHGSNILLAILGLSS